MTTNIQAVAQRALGLIDLTSLNEDDTAERITALARSAKTPFGHPAALCVYAAWVPLSRTLLAELELPDVLVATVVNFPLGGSDAAAVAAETGAACAAGADEIDVVFPWRALMAGDTQAGRAVVAAVRAAVDAANAADGGKRRLKVILESGELDDPALILAASEIAMAAGADFLKTSTGKVARNASLAAARVMLQAIKDSGKRVGFKASGGIRTTAEAGEYLALADAIMGPEWVSDATFRFGASSLLGDLLKALGDAAPAPSSPTSPSSGY